MDSESTVLLHSCDGRGVVLKWLVDVVRVGDVLCSSFLLAAGFSLSKDFLSGNYVLFSHFIEVDVVNFDKVCRETVVKQIGWEDHVVSKEP